MSTVEKGHPRAPGQRLTLRTLRLVWKSSPSLCAATVLMAFVYGLIPAGTVVIIERAVQALVDAGPDGDLGSSGRLALAALIGFVLLQQVTVIVDTYVRAILIGRLTNLVSGAVVEKAASLEVRDFDDSKTYDRIQRAVSESAFRPYQLLVDGIAVVENLVSLVAIAVVLSRWSPGVSVLLVVAAFPVLIVEVIFGRREWRLEHERAAQRRMLDYTQSLLSDFRSVAEVKSFRVSNLLLARYRFTLNAFFDTDKRLATVRAKMTAAAAVVAVAVSGAAIFMGAMSALQRGEVGQFAGYIAAVSAVQGAATGLVFAMGRVYSHRLFIGDLFAHLDYEPAPVAMGSLPMPSEIQQGIEFRDVGFTYPGSERAALEDVSFTVAPGELVAFVGGNGAGKSTILRLVNRLYDPDSGKILLDGRPLSEYDREGLRQSVGVVFQDFLKLELSARENLTFGYIERVDSDEVALAAARRGNALEIISSLPDALDTQLGRSFEDAHQLSVGQWQRLALSRALASNPPLLILDEPAAAIDTEAEAALTSTLLEMRGTTTCMLVSHRLSTVRHADRIVVLEHGRVVEQGRHDHLVRQGGVYARMFSTQASAYTESGAEGTS